MRILVTIVLLVGALSSVPALGQAESGKAAVRGDAKTTQTQQKTLYRELAAEDVRYRTQRAELRRVEQIAAARKDAALQKRVEEARKLARARHEHRLATLRKQYGKEAFTSAERRLESARQAKRKRRTRGTPDRAKRDGTGTRGTTDGRRDTRAPDRSPKNGAPAPKTGDPTTKTGGGTTGGSVPTDRRAPGDGKTKTPRQDDPEIGDRRPVPRKKSPEKPTDPDEPDKPVDPDPDDDYEIDEDGKVTLCHKSGNSGKRHTIRVAPAAVKAHLAHGDTLGPCDGDEKEKGPRRGPKKKGGSDDDDDDDGDDDDDDGDDDDDDDDDGDDDDDKPGKGKDKGKSKGKGKGKGPRA